MRGGAAWTIVAGALGLAACGASEHEMYCAHTRGMPGDGPMYVECWDEYTRCRANARVNDECDPKQTVEPYGFTEERQDTTAEWYDFQRWFANEEQCEKARAETHNGSRNRSRCSGR